MLDNFTLYWLTNSAASSARIYWENREQNLISAAAQKTARDLGAGGHHGVSGRGLSRPGDVGPARLPNLIYFNEADRGGHFAAWEQPELFAPELRAAFRSLR